MIESLGEKTIGGTIPALPLLTASMTASANATLPDVSARLSAALTIQPPSLATDLITNLTAMIAAVQALLASGVTVMPPSVNLSVGADLAVTAAALEASLAIAGQINALLGGAGVYAWVYEGSDQQIGSELQSAIGGGLSGGPACTSIILATTAPGTGLALKTLFGAG